MYRLAGKFALGAVAAAATLGLAATPVAAQTPPVHSGQSAVTIPAAGDVTTLGELPVEWEQQVNGYYCGPAATRMALKARTDPPGQHDLAAMMGTDENGTDHVGLVADAMNSVLGGSYYVATNVDYTPTQPQRDQFRQDLIADIDNGYALVANIWVTPDGVRPPGYPSGAVFHYVAIIGYDSGGDRVLVADPAAGIGGFENVQPTYWLDTYTMVTLIGGKGYVA